MGINRSFVAGAAVFAVLAAGTAAAVASPRALGPGTHEMRISFPSADGLVAGSDVLEAGSKIGVISEIAPQPDDTALVTVQIADDHWPVHQGVSADIRPKSLLGEKYVDIHDGSNNAPTYNTATVLHTTQQAVPVELDQFINSLDPQTRAATRTLLGDLGAGVAGRGTDLNQAIAAGRANLQNLATFGKTLNDRDPDLDRILVGLDDVLQKITTNDQLDQMSQLISNGQQTLNAIETEQQAFSRSFVDAQAALGDLNAAFDSAVPSLRETLNVAPHLVTVTGQESSLLATLGAEASNPVVLSALEKGLLQGPTTTGGGLEYGVPNGHGGVLPPQPIFRICLAGPAANSCTGQGFNNTPLSAVPSSYEYGGGDDFFAGLFGA